MFRNSVGISAGIRAGRNAMQTGAHIWRQQFSVSVTGFAKKKEKGRVSSGKGGKKNWIEEEEDVELVDVREYVSRTTREFEKTVEQFKKKLGEKKVGLASTNIFDGLKVGKEGYAFKDVATTSMKGRNGLIVTVFDPKDTKNVISAIMGAGLNLNAERVTDNEQQLKVALPPVTTERRQAVCKELKKLFEEYKHSGLKFSLGHIRGEVLKDLKKLQKQNDDVKKVIQDVEKLHKEYTSKLQDHLKQAEKIVMKQ